MTRRLALAVLACIASPGFAQSQGRNADVLLVAHPDRLIAYNRYQQRLSSVETGALVAYAPMIVVREDDRLGDGFTACVRVELSAGETMYFQRSSNDGLAASLGAAGARVYRDVQLHGDTVLFRESTSFHREGSDGPGAEVIAAGTSVFRLYEHDGETYVRTLHARPRFGWVTLPRSGLGTAWEPRRQIPAFTIPSLHSLFLRVQTTVAQANSALKSIYSGMREETGKQIATPWFDVIETEAAIHCRLHPPSHAKDLPESLRALAAELTTAYSGSDVTIDAPAGLIIITQR